MILLNDLSMPTIGESVSILKVTGWCIQIHRFWIAHPIDYSISKLRYAVKWLNFSSSQAPLYHLKDQQSETIKPNLSDGWVSKIMDRAINLF